MSTIKDNISHEQIMTAVMKTVAFAEKTIAPIFEGELDKDSKLSCVCATFATVIKNLVDGTVKINLDKKGDVDDEAKKQATEEKKPEKKEQKPGESDENFAKRVAEDIGDKLIDNLGEYKITKGNARVCMGLLIMALIDTFDLREAVMHAIISQLGE